nr:UDP-glycosyltransferase [Nicotiana tabacum]
MVLVDSDTWLVSGFLEFARGYRKAKGIIINTYTELETHALDACKNNISRSGQIPLLPSIYSVVKVVPARVRGDRNNKMAGSAATGIGGTDLLWKPGKLTSEASERDSFSSRTQRTVVARFLWSLRQPPEESSNDKNAQFPGDYTNYFEILPKGFLERTVKKGKVVGWVPQFKVLSHEAIGGFVSHCGWNSILESIWCGVPIATWPLHSEQQVNAFQLVKEIGTAVEITLDYCERRSKDDPPITAQIIEKAIRELMGN